MIRLSKVFFFSVFAFIAAEARADVLSVGPTEEYATIQSAINAAEDGDLVAVAHGTWEEDLTISGKSIIINGDVDALDAVTIKGRIYVKSGAALELNYLSIDATGRNYGVKASGSTKIRYSTISNGKIGVAVSKYQFLELSGVSISNASSYGVSCPSGCKTQIVDSLFDGNGKAGMKISNSRQEHSITDSTFTDNKVGLTLSKVRNTSNLLARCSFHSNGIGFVKAKSVFPYADLTYTGNTRDFLER